MCVLQWFKANAFDFTHEKKLKRCNRTAQDWNNQNLAYNIDL